MLRGGVQAVGAPVQLTEAAVAATEGDQSCTSSCPVKFAGV